MSRIKGKDTGMEVRVRSELHKRGLRFRKHVKGLPGKPDVVFSREKVAVFVDGDFWHGYRFPAWQDKLSPFWREKIAKTRQRDRRNFAGLRRQGWRVIRIWQHQLKKHPAQAIQMIADGVASARLSSH
jgi:DNA mismatch endonuclease (patch repair protein)